jgi:hypothetical protein
LSDGRRRAKPPAAAFEPMTVPWDRDVEAYRFTLEEVRLQVDRTW